MGIENNYKKGIIIIKAEHELEQDIKLQIQYGKLKIIQDDRCIWLCKTRVNHLIPILERYEKTEKIFENKYSVTTTSKMEYMIILSRQSIGVNQLCNASGGKVFKTKEAATLVCDAMNAADLLEGSNAE